MVGTKPSDLRQNKWPHHVTNGFLVRTERKGEMCESTDPLILMGDWCGEESNTEAKARNTGKGEEEPSTGPVLTSTATRQGNSGYVATGYYFPLMPAF